MKVPKGGGFGNAMFATFQRNRAMLKGVGYFDMRKEYLKASNKIQIKDYKTATPDQLKKIRILIKEQKRQEFNKKAMILIVAVVITIALFYGFIYWMRLVFGF